MCINFVKPLSNDSPFNLVLGFFSSSEDSVSKSEEPVSESLTKFKLLFLLSLTLKGNFVKTASE